MSAADGTEPNALRLKAKHLAAELSASANVRIINYVDIIFIKCAPLSGCRKISIIS